MIKKLRYFLYDLLHKEKKDFKGEIVNSTLFTNDYVNLVHDCCVISHGGSIDKPEEKKEEFISKIIGLGHESVIEHSNIIQAYKISKKYSDDLLEVLPETKFLNYSTKIVKDQIYLLIGGSIRGYKELIRGIEDFNNPVFKYFLSSLYDLKACFFTDFINDEIMDEQSFSNITVGDPLNNKENPSYYDNIIEREKYDISSIDDIHHIKELCDNFFGSGVFDTRDIIKVASITIKIKGLSRIISQQVTRHRDAITQASQRYIDISDITFNSPANFKPEKYNNTDLYDIQISDGNLTTPFKFNLQTLGDALCKIYPQLLKQGLLKEDARSYSPNNVTTELYMTFSVKNFIKFLELRTDKGAQAEIRLIADGLLSDYLNYLENHNTINQEELFNLILPKYKANKKDPYENIDEVID